MLAFSAPLVLMLLPLAMLPFFFARPASVAYSSLSLLPADALSDALDFALRLLAATGIAAICFGLAGLHRAEETVERIGEGAQTVILIDSSGSMDRPYVTGQEGRSRAAKWGTYKSKGQIARRILGNYAAQRPQDLFALYVFSGNPIPILPLTDKQDVIQAAIAAGSIERGLASTNLGGGLIQSLQFFEGKPFSGSRIVMLVSDGAATLTLPIQDEIRQLMQRYQATLYWLYLRDQHSPGLDTEMSAARAQDIAPEQIVHDFFSNMGTPYRAYAAENPRALELAIAEVDKLQSLPIRYEDVIPKRDLSQLCYIAALISLSLLAAAKMCEIRQWH